MNNATSYARRYHWYSGNVTSFVDDPHTAVIGRNMGIIMNLSDFRAKGNREGIVSFLAEHPDVQKRELRHLSLPRRHEVTPSMVDPKRLGAILTLAYEKQYKEFTDALLQPGIGPRTLQSLALVSEVIYGKSHRFSDPARFAFAHGGKDGNPFPVPLKVYDESINLLRLAVNRARLGHSEKMRGLKVLTRIAECIEKERDPFADVNRVIAHERRESYKYGGMTVFGKANPLPRLVEGEQLSLFDAEEG
jgi:hypothetical protein